MLQWRLVSLLFAGALLPAEPFVFPGKFTFEVPAGWQRTNDAARVAPFQLERYDTVLAAPGQEKGLLLVRITALPAIAGELRDETVTAICRQAEEQIGKQVGAKVTAECAFRNFDAKPLLTIVARFTAAGGKAMRYEQRWFGGRWHTYMVGAAVPEDDAGLRARVEAAFSSARYLEP